MAKPILLIRVPYDMHTSEFMQYFNEHAVASGMSDEYWITMTPSKNDELEIAVLNAPEMEPETFDYIEKKIKEWAKES